MSEDDYGSCPNCGSMVCHDEMGEENGVVCCKFCYEHERDKQLKERKEDEKTDM